jgi:hypothetical protein
VIFEGICASKISIHSGNRDPAKVGLAGVRVDHMAGEEFQKKERKKMGKNTARYAKKGTET